MHVPDGGILLHQVKRRKIVLLRKYKAVCILCMRKYGKAVFLNQAQAGARQVS